jgi:hypothetical protein
MRKARHEPGADRIRDLREYNRYGAGLPLDCGQDRAGSSEDHIRLRCHELGRIGPLPARITGAPTVVDLDIAAL